MRCPFCDADKESLKVIDSRTCEAGKAIRRRRECGKCEKRFTTYERIEETVRLAVVKKDGKRDPWDRNKILAGLERACFKRPVDQNRLVQIRDEVEDEVFRTHDREVRSDLVGQLVTERLRRLDQVAYVRFASVYKQFKTLDELISEAKAVIDASRYDDGPGQGRLFTDPSTASVEPGEASAPSASGRATSRGRGRRAINDNHQGAATAEKVGETGGAALHANGGNGQTANRNGEPDS